MAEAPPEVGGALALFAGRGGACQVAFCFNGDVAVGQRVLAPLRSLGPSLDAVAVNPYRAFQAMTDVQHPFGMRSERRPRLVHALSDDVLEAVLAAAERPAAALSRIVLRPRGGVLDGVPWECECLALWPPVASLDRGNVAWVDNAVDALDRAAVAV
jgi:hypothetical protein